MFPKLSLALALVLAAAAQTPGGNIPTLFVAGDSTANNSAAGQQGWADPFAAYFDPAKIHVANRARAGRSSRTFQTEGLWDKILAEMKPGDFVLIQFGHNDGGPPDKDRARGSLPGTGDETKEVTMPDGAKEIVHTYGWYMTRFITDTKAKGATPVVLSLTVRNIWTNGKVERGSGQFNKWAAEVAESQHVPFVDVTRIIADRYEQMGEDKTKAFFPGDHTHTNPAGADFNAAAVVAGLRAIENSPFTASFSAKTATRSLNLPEPKDPNLPTLFLIGDSTVRNGRGDGANGQWGWGEPLVRYFDAAKINVVNRAVGGLSSRTYLTDGHWDKVMAMLKPGDFVMMQFGHNDNGPLDDVDRARGTIKGAGEETREIYNPIHVQHEVVHTYGWYLRKFITDAKAKGATPIVCSLVPRKIWKEGKIVRASADYGKWAADVAKSEGVVFIDLNEIIARRYDQLGAEKVEPLFADPHTHTSRAGAELNAECVISGLKALPKDPLTSYFAK
ncbi:MAG: lipolytic protein family [Bryobacterales bacterium]|nr:lipolytic protein family [Bryobacterales bacterium]